MYNIWVDAALVGSLAYKTIYFEKSLYKGYKNKIFIDLMPD